MCYELYNHVMVLLLSDQKIMSELLIHEGRLGGLSGAGPSFAPVGTHTDQYTKYSSSSEEEEEGDGGSVGAQPNPSEESSDEEFTMKVWTQLCLVSHVLLIYFVFMFRGNYIIIFLGSDKCQARCESGLTFVEYGLTLWREFQSYRGS